MAMTISADLPYREGRNYIHSTDLYDSMLANAEKLGFGPVDGQVRLSMRKMLKNQVNIHYLPPGESHIKTAAHADFLVGIGTHNILGWFSETGQPPTQVTPYDEGPIQRMANHEGQAIWIDGNSDCTAIEVATSLTSQLHSRLLPPPEGTKWFDIRLELHRLFNEEDATRMHVEMLHRAGTRITKSKISVDDETIGFIFFSLAAFSDIAS